MIPSLTAILCYPSTLGTIETAKSTQDPRAPFPVLLWKISVQQRQTPFPPDSLSAALVTKSIKPEKLASIVPGPIFLGDLRNLFRQYLLGVGIGYPVRKGTYHASNEESLN